MKKLIIIICILLSAYSLQAQMAFGIPVDFSSLDGAVYNPGTHESYYSDMWVTDRTNDELSSSELAYLNYSIEENHSGHIILDYATATYNCHGYTFGIIQGTDKYNISWRADLCTNSFILVTTPQAGDIAVMRYNNGESDSPHSALVFSQDTLISKWGYFPLTKHHKDSVLFINAYETGQAQYTYYRRVTNTNSMISGPSSINGSGTYTFTPNVTPTNCTWSVEPAEMFQVSSGSGYTANLCYKTPFEYLAPKATLTFTFNYGCANHYTATKEIDLRIPTTTVSGNAISEGFVIDDNAVVTVTGKIKSNSNAKTIVPIGSKLVLDGGVMTSNGNVMWQGIEVWGNYYTHQYYVNGSYGQGYLELKHGAVIENAKCAVELWRPNYWSTTGGIIMASDAIFRNNAKAVNALCYTNISPYTNNIASYKAYFNNCSFVVNGNYLGAETFVSHVTLCEVDGIKFISCDFSANRSVNGVNVWCTGISSYDAGFTVTSACTVNFAPCPESYIDHSTFEGLCAGVCASGTGNNPHTFVVRDAVFNNNDCGINVLNTNFPKEKYPPRKGEDYCEYNYGVCLMNSTSFCIEENHFQPMPNATATTVGISIYNSNSINDIYNNTFEDLHRGSIALGQNTNGSIGALQGLTYTCNEFKDNQRDIMVLNSGGTGDIQSQQGSSAMPAGNKFINSTFQIYNGGTNQISYFYNPNGLNETPNTSMLYRVTRQTANGTNSCNSHYGNEPIVKSPSEKAELASEYYSAFDAYLNFKQLYESHVDDNDTEDPTADNISTSADLFQLGIQMAQYCHEYTLAAGDIVRSNLNDSIANPTELRTWLKNMNDIAADRMVISSYIHEGDSASAFALANRLPAMYELQGDQLTDYNDYMRLIGLYQALHRSGRSIFQLTETEQDLVRDIAEKGIGVSQSMAEALMEQITGRGKDNCFNPEFPNRGDGDESIMTHSSITESRENGLNVNVAPNPATTWTTVNYILPDTGKKALLTLTNTLGVRVLSLELDGLQGNKVLDLRGFAAGVYVYAIRYEQFTEIGKLVISK